MGLLDERICETCGATFARAANVTLSQWSVRRFCSRWCASRRLVKPLALCACGCGKTVALPKCKFLPGHRRRWTAAQTGGYIRVFRPGHPLAMSDGLVLEHRLVLYEAGIEIPDGCHVHHKNGLKHDNRLENLEVLPESEHHRHHVREQGFVVNQYGTWPLRERTA